MDALRSCWLVKNLYNRLAAHEVSAQLPFPLATQPSSLLWNLRAASVKSTLSYSILAEAIYHALLPQAFRHCASPGSRA